MFYTFCGVWFLMEISWRVSVARYHRSLSQWPFIKFISFLEQTPITVTSQQCVAARMLAEVDQALLSEKSGVPYDILSGFEEGRTFPTTRELTALKLSLEALGIEFIPEKGASGVGMRLKFSKGQSAAISTWETEGGEAAAKHGVVLAPELNSECTDDDGHQALVGQQ